MRHRWNLGGNSKKKKMINVSFVCIEKKFLIVDDF